MTTAKAQQPHASAREAAFAVLHRAEAADAFVSILLYHTLERLRLSEVDRSLATAITLGVLRYRERLDFTLRHLLRQPLDDLPSAIRTVLRMGAFQLLGLPRIPAPAAVYESVALARRHGHAGTARLTNAVLRRLATEGEAVPPDSGADPAGHLSVTCSHPRWLVERWITRWGQADAESLAAANLRPAPSVLRVNTLMIEPDAALVALTARGVAAESGLVPEALRVRGSLARRLPLIDEGLAVVQDEGAMLAARAVAPNPGAMVIDACAAPGGKTTHLAALLRNRGRVLACDVHPGKLRVLAERARRLAATCVEIHQLDARQIGRRWPAHADAVLVDAPCSGLGTIRRRPEIKWRAAQADLSRHAELQGAVLSGAAGAVRAGGTLVYSVCSLEPEEGPDVVDAFLRRRPEFERAALPAAFPRVLNAAPVDELRPGEVWLWPHRHDTDGFYIARLRRRR